MGGVCPRCGVEIEVKYVNKVFVVFLTHIQGDDWCVLCWVCIMCLGRSSICGKASIGALMCFSTSTRNGRRNGVCDMRGVCVCYCLVLH